MHPVRQAVCHQEYDQKPNKSGCPITNSKHEICGLEEIHGMIIRCVWIVLLFNGAQRDRRRAIETAVQVHGEELLLIEVRP